jgi:hypothetical protein
MGLGYGGEEKPHGLETRTQPREFSEPLPLAGVSFCPQLSTGSVDPNRVFGSQQPLRAPSLALQGIKKPGVTRTTGWVMGET